MEYPPPDDWKPPGFFWKTWSHLQRPSGSFHVSLGECIKRQQLGQERRERLERLLSQLLSQLGAPHLAGRVSVCGPRDVHAHHFQRSQEEAPILWMVAKCISYHERKPWLKPMNCWYLQGNGFLVGAGFRPSRYEGWQANQRPKRGVELTHGILWLPM